VIGQEVAQLVSENKAAGRYQVAWNGKNKSGDNLSSGVYIYTLKAGSFSYSKKMILTK